MLGNKFRMKDKEKDKDKPKNPITHAAIIKKLDKEKRMHFFLLAPPDLFRQLTGTKSFKSYIQKS